MSRGQKLHNEYAALLGPLYARVPKAVLAAIVVSGLIRQGASVCEIGITDALLDEWDVLHANGIVPQKPERR